MSFFIAMSELGGTVIESINATRKSEEPEDLARVLSGYCHAVMVRTFEDEVLEKMAQYSSIPIINGLSDHFHPCQTLADLMTIREEFGKLEGVKVAYIGDGNNTLQSFLPVVEKTGIELRYACPPEYQPRPDLVDTYPSDKIICCDSPQQAVEGADVIYTDVWASMGFEDQSAAREKAFQGFQVTKALMESTGKDTKLMHCLPMVRGKEVEYDLPDSEASLIFKQSENRLHVQKSLLLGLLN